MRRTVWPTTLLCLLAACAVLASPASAAERPEAPILLNADFAGDRFGFLSGECPAAFEPRVEGDPESPPRFGVDATAGVSIEAAAPLRAELSQPLNAGFGHDLLFRAPVLVTGDAEARIGLVRHDNPEDADWSAPAGPGAATLEVRARVDHPGARLVLRFDARATAPSSLAVRAIEAARAGDGR